MINTNATDNMTLIETNTTNIFSDADTKLPSLSGNVILGIALGSFFPVPNMCIHLRGWKFDEKNTENKPQNGVLLLKE